MKFKKIYFLILILILHSIFVILNMNQPYHGDEVLHQVTANAIIKTGKPVIDYGSNNPNFEALWHIPLFIYSIVISILLFGDNIYSVRAIAAIFNLLTVVLVYFITKEILKDNENKENWALFAAFIYAFNPLTIQSSILVDIDGGLLNFSAYLFLYLFIKKKSLYYLIPSLGFVFISKEIGPVILFLNFILFYIITFNWRDMVKILVLFFFGGLFYLIVWKIFSSILDLNFLTPIKHNFGGGSSVEISLFHIMRSIWEFKNFFYFSVPFFVILFLVLTIVFYYKIIKNKEYLKQTDTKNALLFNILALLIFILYLYFGGSAWGFPKYQILALPAMSIFIAYILSKTNYIQYIFESWKSKKIYYIVLGILVIIYFLFFIGDPLIPEIDTSPGNVNVSQTILLVIKSFTLYISLPIFLCLFVFYLIGLKQKFFITLVFLSLLIIFYINIMHVVVDYSTYNKYGDVGVFEVVDYVHKNNIPAESIATHVHIGSYLGMAKYFEITFVYNDDNRFKKEIIENDDIEYIIIWKRDISRIGENIEFFKLEKQVGSYYVFKKK